MSTEPQIRAIAEAGLRLGDRVLNSRRGDRLAVIGLGLVLLVYAASALYMTRGATFIADELTWLIDAGRGFDPEAILAPHNGHLIAITRLWYAGTLETFGPDHVVIELFTIVNVAATATLLFVLLRSRIGAVTALLPAVLVLFLGSTEVPLAATITVFAQSSALGLGAILCLERDDPRWDVAAGALLVLGVASFSLGVTFVVGAAVLIGLRPDPLRRAWLVVAPLALYAAWYVWAQKFDPEAGSPTDLLLAPTYGAQALAAALSYATGLARDASGDSPDLVSVGWGQALAVVVVVVLARQALRAGVSSLALAVLAVLVAYWTLAAFGMGAFDIGPVRGPESARYAFPTIVLLVLLAGEIFRAPAPGRWVALAVALAVAFSLPGNLFRFKEVAASIRLTSEQTRSLLAMVELERDQIEPSFTGSVALLTPSEAGQYLGFAGRFGSIGATLDEVQAGSPEVREQADQALERILSPALVEVGALRCASPGVESPGEAFALPPGGATLRSPRTAEIELRRFADTNQIAAGTLSPGQAATLELPTDGSAQSWSATSTGSAPVRLCPAVGGEG